jgi:TrmH family RNA methyltransferase
MWKPETIASAANPLLKDVKRAIARGSLTESGWCVAETFHLLDEALSSACAVKTVLASESAFGAVEARLRGLPDVKLMVLPDALFAGVAATETSQGVIALVQPPAWNLEDLLRGTPLVVVLDGVQDPGNAGTILRTAEAFGVSGVLFLKGTVSPYNPKTLRASAGSLFRVRYVHGVAAAFVCTALAARGVALFAGVPAGSGAAVRPLAALDLTGPSGLIVGNEARGVGAELRAAASDIAIPTVGVESLNAGVAAGILMYEARRQRALAS